MSAPSAPSVVRAPPSAPPSVVRAPLTTAAGVSWSLRSANASASGPPLGPIPATVPGQATLDLLAAGLIPEPDVDVNVDAIKWVAATNWTFASAPFALPFDPDAYAGVDLLLYGVDTVAVVSLNGATLVESDNMFATLKLPVGGIAAASGNVLTVAIRSPLEAIAEAAAACAARGGADFCPPLSNAGSIDGMLGVNYLRKQ